MFFLELNFQLYGFLITWIFSESFSYYYLLLKESSVVKLMIETIYWNNIGIKKVILWAHHIHLSNNRCSFSTLAYDASATGF